MQKPGRVVLATAGAALGVAVVVVSMAVTNGSPVFWEHYRCAQGKLLASQYNWTPELFENAPYGGSVFAGARSLDGAEGGWSYNGTVALFFGQAEWNLTMIDRVLVSGPGSSPQCPTFDVTHSPSLAPWQQSGGCGGCQLLGPGNKSDAGVPTQFNMSIWGPGIGISSVTFHDAYVVDNDGNVSTCGRAGTSIEVRSSNLDFQIPFRTANGTVLIDSTAYGVGPASIPGFVMNFTYSFPANFGTWQIDNLTLGPNAPGSGLAFSYLPCEG